MELLSQWRRIALGTGIAFLAMLMLAALTAWMLDQRIVTEEWLRYLSFLIIFIPAFLGGRFALVRQGFDPGVVLAGVGFWLLLMLIRILLFEGSVSGAFSVAAGVLAGNLCALFPGRQRSTEKRRRRKKRRR